MSSITNLKYIFWYLFFIPGNTVDYFEIYDLWKGFFDHFYQLKIVFIESKIKLPNYIINYNL